jgi:4-aminobutyrate aminotransferase-like enzyme
MEYMSTFGGNPVSCAVGLAVLREIDERALQENARIVGAHLLSGLRAIESPFVGDVRGRGLFVGVELMRDGAPAPDVADRVVNRLRREGVLISTDGPDGNVIKIKPPLVFSRENADELVELLRAALD